MPRHGGRLAAFAGLLVALSGCSLFSGSPEPEPDRVARLEAQVAALSAELRALREELDVAADVVAQTPDPSSERAPAQRADFALLEDVVVGNADLADAVDVDLEAVENEVDALQAKLAVVEAKLASVEGVVNNHADVLDGMNADLADLENETDSLRPLNDFLYFDDGKIFVDGVDMVFRPGQTADGKVKSTGPVLVRPPIE